MSIFEHCKFEHWVKLIGKSIGDQNDPNDQNRKIGYQEHKVPENSI